METAEVLYTDLSTFTNGSYNPGKRWRIISWYFINYFVFNSALPWPYQWKLRILHSFGAQVGKGLVIKTKVRIKYPWHLTIGDHCWIGESVWIDNLSKVTIGNNVCISQGAMLLTGNHDYSQPNFAFRLGNIEIEDGVWIGAKSIVCPGVSCKTHAVLTVNSVATKNLDRWSIYAGNPARKIRDRKMHS
ncbi:WcaF family extracellular polysaccharide biosynthesis acetyltransferase [Pedobacter sp.]|uniref:WcaF family extracellular polysaccharide biosynthesis acetyltransferase n=1 Tax=Pedobacter sp. TaxID=1411316 RepID=UPI003D7FC1E1